MRCGSYQDVLNTKRLTRMFKAIPWESKSPLWARGPPELYRQGSLKSGLEGCYPSVSTGDQTYCVLNIPCSFPKSLGHLATVIALTIWSLAWTELHWLLQPELVLHGLAERKAYSKSFCFYSLIEVPLSISVHFFENQVFIFQLTTFRPCTIRSTVP